MAEFEVDGVMYASLEDFCNRVPPKDPELAAIWRAYGPENYPPHGFIFGVHPNPWDEIARRLFPNSTPESVAKRWEEISNRRLDNLR